MSAQVELVAEADKGDGCSNSATRSKQFVAALLLAVVAGAIVLRTWSRAGQSLWFDEAFSWRLASFPWAELLRRAALDNNPPLYYLLLKCWMLAFGESPATLWSLSGLLSGLACAGLFAFVAEAYRPAETRCLAVLSAALLATNGFQVYWGGQVRMYGLVAALATCSSWLLLRALHTHERSLRRWLLYSIVALLFAYSHTYALLSIALQAIFVAGMLIARRLIRGYSVGNSLRGVPQIPTDASQQSIYLAGPLLAFSVIAAGWLPWLPILLRQQAQVHDAFWLPPLSWWGVRNAWHTLITGPASAGGGAVQSLVCGAPLVALLLLLWRPRPADWFVFLAAILPFAAGIVISACDRNILLPRYLIASQPFILVAVAKMILAVPKPAVRATVASLVLLLSLVMNRELVGPRPTAASGIRAAAAFLDAARLDESPIISTYPFFYLPLVYNLRGHANSFLFDNGLPLPHYEGSAALTSGELLHGEQIASIESPQVFIVSNSSPLANQTGFISVPEYWRLVRRTEFYESHGIPGKLTVAEYRTR